MKKTIFAVILIALALGINSAQENSTKQQTQPQKSLSAEQVRGRFMGQIQAEMRRKNILKDGWHEAFNTSEGRIFAYLQSGQVRHLAVSGVSGSSPKIVAFLDHNASGRNADLYENGLNISQFPNTGGGGDDPSPDECSRMILRCLLATIDVYKLPGVFSKCDTGNVITCAKAVIDAIDPPKKSAKCDKCIQMLFPD